MSVSIEDLFIIILLLLVVIFLLYKIRVMTLQEQEQFQENNSNNTDNSSGDTSNNNNDIINKNVVETSNDVTLKNIIGQGKIRFRTMVNGKKYYLATMNKTACGDVSKKFWSGSDTNNNCNSSTMVLVDASLHDTFYGNFNLDNNFEIETCNRKMALEDKKKGIKESESYPSCMDNINDKLFNTEFYIGRLPDYNENKYKYVLKGSSSNMTMYVNSVSDSLCCDVPTISFPGYTKFDIIVSTTEKTDRNELGMSLKFQMKMLESGKPIIKFVGRNDKVNSCQNTLYNNAIGTCLYNDITDANVLEFVPMIVKPIQANKTS